MFRPNWERVDVIAAAMFVFASVINRRRVGAGRTPGKANGAPQLQEQFEREQHSLNVGNGPVHSVLTSDSVRENASLLRLVKSNHHVMESETSIYFVRNVLPLVNLLCALYFFRVSVLTYFVAIFSFPAQIFLKVRAVTPATVPGLCAETPTLSCLVLHTAVVAQL